MTDLQIMIISAFEYITERSTKRSNRWHKDGELNWTILEWAGAMCGEAGEAANVAKKIVREESGMQNGISTGLTTQQLNDKFGKELADTFLYLVLCAQNRNLNLGEYIISVFNEKSKEYGFPEKL